MEEGRFGRSTETMNDISNNMEYETPSGLKYTYGLPQIDTDDEEDLLRGEQ